MDFKEEIIKNEGQLLAAFKGSDLPVLDALLHDDMLFTNQNGQVMTKEMDLETHRKGDLIILDIVVNEQVISLIGDTGIVAVKKQITGKYCGETFQGTFRFTRVWKRFNIGWKVIAASGVPVT